MITDGTRGRPRPSGLAANPVPEPVHRSLSTPWPPTCGLTRPRPCRPSGPSGQHSSGPGAIGPLEVRRGPQGQFGDGAGAPRREVAARGLPWL